MSDKSRENSYRKQKKVVHSLFFHALWAVLLTLVLLSGMTGCAREEKEDSGLLLYYLNEDLSSLNTLSYLMEDGKLVLGPFQGRTACIIIPLGRGVCGTAAAAEQVQRVADVHEFPGHIACDADSASEIVVPIHVNGQVVGVLDIDSPM